MNGWKYMYRTGSRCRNVPAGGFPPWTVLLDKEKRGGEEEDGGREESDARCECDIFRPVGLHTAGRICRVRGDSEDGRGRGVRRKKHTQREREREREKEREANRKKKKKKRCRMTNRERVRRKDGKKKKREGWQESWRVETMRCTVEVYSGVYGVH